MFDPYGETDNGHHWIFSLKLIQAFEKLNLDYVFLSPSPAAAEDFLKLTQKSLRGFNFVEMPKNQDDWKNKARNIINEIDRSDNEINLLFSWLPIFSELEMKEIVNDILNKKVTISGVTQLNKNSVINYKDDYGFEFQDLFNESDRCKILWVWHEPNRKIKSSNKVRRLPEYFPPSAAKVESKKAGIELNFYGRLSAFRGISEILIISLFNPKIKVNIKGLGFSIFGLWRPSQNYFGIRRNPVRGVLAVLISFLVSFLRYLPNVNYSSKPYQNESELEKAIVQSKFIFIGCKLPHSSGIALTAMANEIPIIWFGNIGEGVRVLREGSSFGEVRYRDFFIPGKITRIICKLDGKKSRPIFSYEDFTSELKRLNS